MGPRNPCRELYEARLLHSKLVRSERLELSRLSALPPQDSVSTNSTTTALRATGANEDYFGISEDFEAGSPDGAGAEEAGAAGFESTLIDCVTPPDFAGDAEK